MTEKSLYLNSRNYAVQANLLNLAEQVAALLDVIRVEACEENGGRFYRAKVYDRSVDAATPLLLKGALGGLIYSSIHAGQDELPDIGARSVRNINFESRLREVVPHGETVRRTEIIEKADEGIICRIDGVLVTIPNEYVLSVERNIAQIRLPATRPALSPGFFLVDSSRPRKRDSEGPIRVYVNVADSGALPAIWGSVLQALEISKFAYRAKALSNPLFVPRRDAVVVYLHPEDADAIQVIKEKLSTFEGLGMATSPFVRRICDGIGVAREPIDHRPGMQGRSFGEHRAAALAEGIVNYMLDANSYPDLPSAIVEEFLAAGIDPENPCRNIRPEKDRAMTVS